MYSPVSKWLGEYLQDRHRKATVRVFDASRKSLARLIKEQSLSANLPPEWVSWDIYIDIVGFILSKATTELAFVECKNAAHTLINLSQLLGYCRIVNPLYALLLAPQRPSDSLRSLLVTYNRMDVLQYHKSAGKLPRSIVVARWDEISGSLDNNSIIRGDENTGGRL